VLLVLRYKTELITTIILLSCLHCERGGNGVSRSYSARGNEILFKRRAEKSYGYECDGIYYKYYNANITTWHSVFGVALVGARVVDDLV
jgi:hypothetical protein